MQKRETVVAVVVAYNRRELARECVEAVLAQSRVPDAIVVVDNASTDGTAESIADLAGVDLRVLPRNTGGAGGFAAGMAVALTDHAADWIWVMDDDTIPTTGALDSLLTVAGRAPADTSVLGSRATWTDGNDHPMNTPRRNPFAGRARRRVAQRLGAIDVRSSSFVSMLVRADTVRDIGLPVADYFIWNDDFEFSVRAIRAARGLYVPQSVVVHKTRALASTDTDPGSRFFYEVRNKVWLMRFSRGLSPAEKIVYGAATIVRWAKTFVRSSDRRVLVDGLRRGTRDGLARRPRPNSEVMADLGGISAAVAAADGSSA